MYDLAIIGGGPAGYVAAENAGAKGLRTVLFEKRELGGVCLNEGCIPTKTLLYSAKMYEHAQGGKKYGITADNVAFDYKKIADRKTKVVRKLVAGIKMKMVPVLNLCILRWVFLGYRLLRWACVPSVRLCNAEWRRSIR